MINKNKSGYQLPEYRKPTPPPPPPPTSGSNAVKPKKPCVYETLCGWCVKWDKKCDKRIGGGNDVGPRKRKNAELEYIKSGKGMPNTKEN